MISGTSADGIDVACVRFSPTGNPQDQLELISFETIAYEPEIATLIMRAAADKLTLRETAVLHTRLGEIFAQAALKAIPREGCDLIASHGQTVCHLPEQNTTLQLGEGAIIANRTNTLTVSDFRTADMAAGGQGAPLVPLFDHYLLSSPDTYRVAVNLGGIANITVLPPGGGAESVRAWDTGPANSVSDAIYRLAGKGTYDRGGDEAAKGTVDEKLLGELLRHEYFSLTPPKSTGLEDFGEAYAKKIFQTGEVADLLRTALALSAQTLVDSIAGVVESRNDSSVEVILAGGGTSNKTLMAEISQRLQSRLGSRVRILKFSDFGIPEDAREAVAFAFLGDQTVRGKVGSVPSTTGAWKASVLGKVSFP